MATSKPTKPRLFVDADVLFAGSASSSEYGASLTILRMAEITLIDALTSEQAIVEVERNLAIKLPAKLPAFRLLVARCLTVVPTPNAVQITPYSGLADRKDLPILVAAIQHDCPLLVTFNVRHYRPGHRDIATLNPGEFIQRVRHLLTAL
ncbi:MAG TPA: PIN domain-containing protein [Promineifilum sp.]|nr:PIN domain-containing protein [Promineifilum sp.]